MQKQIHRLSVGVVKTEIISGKDNQTQRRHSAVVYPVGRSVFRQWRQMSVAQ